MKKHSILSKLALTATMLATLAFTACSSDDDVTQNNATPTAQDDGAINFNVYMNRSTTRAYTETSGNILTLGELQNGTGSTKYSEFGFGVFAYYTEKSKYSQNATPSFMYNQQVLWNKTKNVWEYTPLKYWPNGYGEATQEGVGDIPVYTSFFAYAPYSKCDPDQTDFKTDWEDATNECISACPAPDEQGNPYVRYRLSNDPALWQADLCYAAPLLNQQKPDVYSKLDFQFYHALAALAVTIDTKVDQILETTGELDANTRIYVRSVTFEGFTTEGTLNLNSPAGSPSWTDYAGTGTITKAPVVINDLRRDGREAVTEDLGEKTITEASLLNPDIIQGGAAWNTNDGVNKTKRNLFAKEISTTAPSAADPSFALFVIPNGDPLKVTITYDVETQDPNIITSTLSDGTTYGTSIENTITKSITLDSKAITLQAGKRYNLALHLGMTSVQFDASVSEWDTPATDEIDVDAPRNVGPLTIQPLGNGKITVHYAGTRTLYYKKNGGSKTAAEKSGNDLIINVNSGDIVELYGSNNDYDLAAITCSAPFYLYGNIMSLVFDEDYENQYDLSGKGEGTFQKTFSYTENETNLLNHPTFDIYLPATTLKTRCYHSLFDGCEGLTRAPILPATTMEENCYELMFSDCTGLTKAPELPATTLADGCYDSMFNGCTSLTEAPELPAKTLVKYCYIGMFNGCSNLKYIKCLATDVSATQCTDGWLEGVSATGTFVKAASMTGWTDGEDGIPTGWTVKDAE